MGIGARPQGWMRWQVEAKGVEDVVDGEAAKDVVAGGGGEEW